VHLKGRTLHKSCCYNFAVMRIIVLAVLLAVVQASPPTTRNSGGNGASTTAANATTTISAQVTDEDSQIQRELALFTGGLVLVGILQTVVMLLTWRIYRRQAHEMRRQRHEMRRQRHVMYRQWKAMGAQAGLMTGQLSEMQKSRELETKVLVLQYRPKIIVRDAKASDFNVAELGQPSKANVKFTFINTGGTPAHITYGTAAMWSVEASKSPAPIEFERGDDSLIDPVTLQPGESIEVGTTLDAGVTNDIQWANYHQSLPTEPAKYIYLLGVIRYVDDLGITRRTGFGRKYDPKTRTFLPEDNADKEYVD
jgi:hypothetical protein